MHVRQDVEDEDFQFVVVVVFKGRVGDVYLMILLNFRGFMFWSVRYDIVLGQFWVC